MNGLSCTYSYDAGSNQDRVSCIENPGSAYLLTFYYDIRNQAKTISQCLNAIGAKSKICL